MKKKFHTDVKKKQGVTLLLVVVIASAILAISTGIFNIVIGELLISGEIADSFVAFYAADKALDKFLYLDRVGGGLANGATEDTTGVESPAGCYVITIYKTLPVVLAQCGSNSNNVCVKSTGQFRCGPSPAHIVKRGFTVMY